MGISEQDRYDLIELLKKLEILNIDEYRDDFDKLMEAGALYSAFTLVAYEKVLSHGKYPADVVEKHDEIELYREMTGRPLTAEYLEEVFLKNKEKFDKNSELAIIRKDRLSISDYWLTMIKGLYTGSMNMPQNMVDEKFKGINIMYVELVMSLKEDVVAQIKKLLGRE